SARVRVRGDRTQGPDLRLDAGDLGLERRRLLGESLVSVCLRKLGLAIEEFDHPLAAVWSDLAALLIAGADRLVDGALRRCDTLGDRWGEVRHLAARLACDTKVAFQCRSPSDRGPARVGIGVAQVARGFGSRTPVQGRED